MKRIVLSIIFLVLWRHLFSQCVFNDVSINASLSITDPRNASVNWTNPTLQSSSALIGTANLFVDGVFVPGTSNPRFITGLSPGTLHIFMVRISSSCDESQIDEVDATTMLFTPPASPVTVNGSSDDSGSINIFWNGVTGATSYLYDVSTTNFATFIAQNVSVTTTSAKVTALSAGTTYSFRVRAKGNGGTSPISNTSSSLTRPAVPSLSAATNIQITQFDANWATPASATSYELDVSTDNAFTQRLNGYNPAVITGGTITSATVTGLSGGTNYFYRVRALNSSGASANATLPVQVLTAPAAPNGLSVQGNTITTSSMQATWQSSANAAQYELLVSTNQSFSNLVSGYNPKIVTGTTALVNTSLSQATTYYLKVRAKNTGGYSGYSSFITAVTLPVAPIAVLANNITTNSFVANWNAVTGTVSSYKLDVSTDQNFTTRLPNYDGVSVTGNSKLVSDLTGGIIYYYRVRAVNGSGESVSSVPIEVLTSPSAPLGFDVSSITFNSLTAQWLTTPTATQYELYISKNETFSKLITDYNPKVINGTFTSENVTALEALTTYYLRMRAKNASGYSAYSPVKIVTTTPTAGATPITFNNINYPISHMSGAANDLSVTVAGGTGTLTVILYHRKNSSLSYTSEPVQLINSTYKITTDDSWYDNFGIQFYFEAHDQANQIKKSAEDTNPHVVLSAIPNVTIPITSFGTETKNYQIVSFPYALSKTQIETIMVQAVGKEYNKTQWRFVQYQNNKNIDFLDGLGKEDVSQGKGYWFISKTPVDLSFGQGTTFGNSTLKPFKLLLKKGWNQIGNPFPYTVSWTDVLTSNNRPFGVGNLLVFNPETVSFNEDDKLKLFGGGFVFAENNTELTFAVTLGNAGGRIATTESENENFEQDPADWLLPIDVLQGEVTNTGNGVGMHHQASEGKDSWDRVTAPRFVRFLEFSSNQSGYEYDLSTSIVPVQDHYTWKYSLTSDVTGPVKLTWDKSIAANNGQLILHDLRANILTDMSKLGEYTTTQSASFLIYYNKQKNFESEQVTLGVPYPNPFESLFTLPFDYSDTINQSNALLTIYDLKGTEIAQISQRTGGQQNLQTIQWNGQTSDGISVSPGLYLYKLVVIQGDKSRVQNGKIIKR